MSEAENARIEGRVTNDRRQNCRHIDLFQPFYYFSFISFARVKLTYSPLSSPTPNENDVVLPCIVIPWSFSYIEATLNGGGGGGVLSMTQSVVETGELFYT